MVDLSPVLDLRGRFVCGGEEARHAGQGGDGVSLGLNVKLMACALVLNVRAQARAKPFDICPATMMSLF